MRIYGHGLRQVCLHLPECEECTPQALAPAGHGLCGCGQVGPHVVSYKDRRRWHSDHVLQIHDERMLEGLTNL